MEPTDLTTKILIDIRDELKGVRTDVSQVKAGLDHTNERLDQTNERLDNLHQRQVETEVRLATELVEVNAGIQQLVQLFQKSLAQKERLEDHERRIVVLEQQSPQR